MLEEKSNHQDHPVTNPATYNKDLLARYTDAIVATKVMGVTNHFWLDLRITPQDGRHI